MSRIISRNVIRLVEVVHTETTIFLVTELCNGGDLEQVLGLNKRISREKVI